VVNQILLHPYVIKSTEPLLAYMHKHHIVPEAYSALIPITQHPDGPVTKPVTDIAERLGKKPEQVLLAWVRAKQYVPSFRCLCLILNGSAIIVTTSSRKERLQGYLEVGDIELSHDDVKAIDKAGNKGYLRSAVAKRAVLAAKAVGLSAGAYYLVSMLMSGFQHAM
jgi:diketogulonate reductase-like aldo/keto reductase